MRTAVVELSGAGIRAVVAEPTDGGWLHVSADRRVVLGFGRAVQRDGRFGEGLLQLSEETLRRLRESVFRSGADRVVGVVAAGLHLAADCDDLVERTERTLLAAVQRRSAAAEVRYLAAAVDRTLVPQDPRVIVAVGEHDLRLVHVSDGSVALVADRPGGVRGLQAPGLADPLHPAALDAIDIEVAGMVAALPEPAAFGLPVAVGPPVQALARAVVAHRTGRGISDVTGTHLSAGGLAAIERAVVGSTPIQQLLMPVVDPADDLEVTALAARMMGALLRHLDVPAVTVASAGVLDGQLLALFETAAVGGAG